MENRTTSVHPEVTHICKVALILFFLFMSGFSCSFALDIGFYDLSCPDAEFIVRTTVRSAAFNDATVPPKLLRLLFHDCFVEGCDASVLVEGEDTERDDPANASLGGFEVIEAAKAEIEDFCPGIVSCADILAMAARDAVALTGGPDIQIPKGRLDGRVSALSNVRPNLIDTSFTVDTMIQIFGSKGLSMEDIVILSGAHTIGSAHCSVFDDRFKIDSNGNLTFCDSTLSKGYALSLGKKCSKSESEAVMTDPNTPFYFDNQYYKNLIAHRGLFQTDSELYADQRTKNLVEQFANDSDRFYQGWSESFIKVSSIGVKTDSEGEVRQICSQING
ncbi:peroxidase 46-like [Silene latifolia]|uniref:peroxidase 46-like n=1 Tax=Silene latifolia TaxID=37657 RepID=UPI003D779CD5